MNFDDISTIVYQPKNDHEPGFIYLMEAEGYHGLIPGAWLRRCKIGLSRNPEARLDNFHRNQPPCNVKILKTIYVENMADVEGKLHQQFSRCNVKLIIFSMIGLVGVGTVAGRLINQPANSVIQPQKQLTK